MNNKTYKHWKLEFDETNILWLHLDVAESGVNLLSSFVFDELDAILDDLAKDLPQGVIILSDKKDSFVFGADIKEFTTLENQKQAVDFLERGHALMNKVEALSCPTVSMIHGMCLGGGTELSLACDYRVMSDESFSRIGLPEIKLGIFPGYGGTVRSIRRTGPLAAMNMMLTGRALTTRTAKKIKLIDEMVPLRQLRAAAENYALTVPLRNKLPFVTRLSNSSLLRPLVASQMRKQVATKAKVEHYQCFTARNAAGKHVIQGFFFNFSNCCTMSTFYVISINFQLWFGIYSCIITQQDVFIRLKCIGNLCIFSLEYFPIECSRRFIFNNPLV